MAGIVLPQPVIAQTSRPFTPAAVQPADQAGLIQSLESHYQETIRPLKNSGMDKHLRKAYEERHTLVLTRLEESAFLFDAELTRYLNTILDEIIAKNPGIQGQHLRLFISRDPSPNAVSLGDGVLFFHVGLLRHMQNESQIAYVLCHEIAHYTLKHMQVNVAERVNTLESKQTQDEIRNIRKSEYGTHQQAIRLMKTLLYEAHRSSRRHEMQADSLGLVYLKRTRYNAGEAIATLAILDRVDDITSEPVDFARRFASASFPFQDRWLVNDVSTFVKGELTTTFHEDSLKTHPDCTIRINQLSTYLGKEPEGKPTDFQGQELLDRLIFKAEMESVGGLYADQAYGKCLFEAFQLMRQYPDQAYLHAMIGLSLQAIYRAQKAHELGKYLEQPNSVVDTAYNQLLVLVHNLRLSELRDLGHAYLTERAHQYHNDEFFLYVLYNSYLLKEDTVMQEKIYQEYIQKFPEGKLISKI